MCMVMVLLRSTLLAVGVRRQEQGVPSTGMLGVLGRGDVGGVGAGVAGGFRFFAALPATLPYTAGYSASAVTLRSTATSADALGAPGGRRGSLIKFLTGFFGLRVLGSLRTAFRVDLLNSGAPSATRRAWKILLADFSAACCVQGGVNPLLLSSVLFVLFLVIRVTPLEAEPSLTGLGDPVAENNANKSRLKKKLPLVRGQTSDTTRVPHGVT